MDLLIACEIKQPREQSPRPRSNVAWDRDSEHLSLEALAEIKSALLALGYGIEIAESYELLQQYKGPLCINLSVGHGGPSTKVFTAALLEILGIPYLGSPPHALAITRDKSISKAVARWLGIPTPRWQVVTPGAALPKDFRFPLIVKPIHESSSIGIYPGSVVDNINDLKAGLSRIWDVYQQSALIEEYVPGVDVEVPFVGEGGILGFAGVVPRIALQGCDILTATAVYGDAYDFIEPKQVARWSDEIESKLRSWVVAFAIATGVRDYGRLDFRVTPAGEVYFIEASTHPYLAHHSTFCWLYKKSGRVYEDLWADLLTTAFNRYQSAHLNQIASTPTSGRAWRGR